MRRTAVFAFILMFTLSLSLSSTIAIVGAASSTVEFRIEASPSTINLTVGETQNIIITVTKLSKNFKGDVSLSAEDLPQNVNMAFEPLSGRPNFTSIVTINVNLQSQTGEFNVRITGTSKWASSSTTITLSIGKPLTGTSGSLGVVYYGWLVKDQSGMPSVAAQRIASFLTSSDFLVAAFYTVDPKYVNLSPQVLALMHSKGVKVFAYVPTNYAKRPIDEVIAEANEYLSKGVDGIFFDETASLQTSTYYSYYETLYKQVKTHKADKTVILNTGLSDKWTGEAIMNVTDILCVEHQWTPEAGFGSQWAFKYPASRFMGLSEGIMDAVTAASLTKQAWSQWVGIHYSTSRYTQLEPWWEEYIDILKKSY